ncbi:MAG: 30S ribosomal protein S6 [Patescibacteria group bacterium]
MDTNKDLKSYELAYILVPTVAEESLPLELEGLKNACLASLGQITHEEFPRARALAYEIEERYGERKVRFTSGHFGVIRFEGDPSLALATKEALEKLPSMLRYLLVSLSKEELSRIAERELAATLVVETPLVKDTSIGVSDEVIDKEISDMLAPII